MPTMFVRNSPLIYNLKNNYWNMPKEISIKSLYPGVQKDTVDLNYQPAPSGIKTDRVLTNGIVTIAVSNDGAELTSIKKDATQREYLWQADPKYWKRHSPVLFPIVGAVWDGEYRSKGQKDILPQGAPWIPQTYRLGQHGFARDMVFTLIEDQPDPEGNPQLLYVLKSSDETLKKFPYRFRLEIGYVLKGNAVEVVWRVMNPSREEELKFQIGAHPAFYWPLLSNAEVAAGVDAQDEALSRSSERGFFRLPNAPKVLQKSVITQKGCVDPAQSAEVKLDDDGFLPLDTHTFDGDALIFEDGQVQVVTLCDQDRKPYLTLESKAPLMGLWSPPGKNAPFVCIEPWYGRTDRVGFAGEYEQKDWIQTLAPLGVFEVSYRIVLE